MPRKTVSIQGLIEKNKLNQDTPWLFLFDLQVDATTTLHFVNYPESVVWNGVTYTPYYLRMDSLKEESNGALPTITVTVSNVIREMEALMQSSDPENGLMSGLRGRKVAIHVVHKDDPTAGELVQDFIITASSSDATTATFTLEKSLPAMDAMLPGRTFNSVEFPGIQNRLSY